MGLTIKNNNSFALNEELSSIFSLPIEEKQEDYKSLKEAIYSLKIDNEEKANIINKINQLTISNNPKEKNKIKEEINQFRAKHFI